MNHRKIDVATIWVNFNCKLIFQRINQNQISNKVCTLIQSDIFKDPNVLILFFIIGMRPLTMIHNMQTVLLNRLICYFIYSPLASWTAGESSVIFICLSLSNSTRSVVWLLICWVFSWVWTTLSIYPRREGAVERGAKVWGGGAQTTPKWNLSW